MTNQEIKTVGQTIAAETQIGGNTAERVGGVIEGIGDALDNKDAAVGYYLATMSGLTIYINASSYRLGTGGNLRAKMPAAATTACTLTVGNAQAVQLWYNGAAVSADNSWEAGEIVTIFYDGTRFMASNSQGGGGQFGSGEKIKDILLSQVLGAGTDAITSQKGVSDAIFNEIDISSIDTLKTLNDALAPSSSLKPTYYTVTATLSSVKLKVGSMAVISDNMRHVVTEIMATHYILDDAGNLTNEHSDAEIFFIYRSVKLSGGTLPDPAGTWTKWRYVNSSAWSTVAEKIKYDNSISGLAVNNVQEAVDEIAEDLETEQKNILTGFQIATNKASSTWYATSIGFEKGKRYHIRVTASVAYTNATAIILQIVSQQFEGQKKIGTLPANSLSAEFDYLCVDDNLQYFCTYASGRHTVTYGIVVSEYLEINEAVNKNRELLCPQATYINFYMASSFVIATGPLTRAKYYTVQSGQKFRIKANSIYYANILFLTSLPETLSNNQDLSSYKVGSQISIAPNTEKIIEIPATAGIMWVNVSTYYQGNFLKFEPEYVSIIDEGSEGFDDVTNSNEWIVRNGAFFASNGKYVLHEGSAFKYIPVQVGEKYVIVANSRCYCVCALMRSIPATITHWSDVDAVGYADIPYKQDLTLEIPSGCNYLAVSVANTYRDYEPSYVGKLSSAKSLNDNTIINTALINNVNAERILLFPVYGQSLAIGGDATPITTYCRFPKNCANNTTLGLQFGQNLETSVYGLVESYVDFKGQEDRIPATRQTDIIASFSSGQGSTPISGLIKGTTLYTNLISSITSAYNARNGIKLIIPAFCWIQGEGDIGNGVDYYYNALSQLRSDLDTDIKAITGQTEDVHCIVYQTNQLCPSPTSSSYYNPTAYASGGSLSARMDGSVVALWKLVRDSQYFHVSSPIYPMNFVVSPNKAIIHISGVSQKLLGYYEGLAAKRLMDGHGDDIGLYVTNVTKVDNTHIRLSLHVPAPPIVVDTESVYETANYGFSVINENSQNIISAVSIERNNLDSTTILITTSADCTNAKVRYGVNGTHGYSGFDKGPRGNIRDSQGLWYKAVINNRKVPMHNWLLFFEYLIES